MHLNLFTSHLLADKDVCPEQDCFIFRFKKTAFMKGGAVSSLQIWIYKLLDETKNDLGNQLKVSVARVRKGGVLSKQGHERDNLLISMRHEGDAGWLGKHLFYLQL